MSRAGLAFALAVALPLGAAAQWTAMERLALPLDGTPVELRALAAPHEARTVRVRLSGTVSFGYDGSELDAMGRTVGGVRDDTAGPFVALPPGTALVEGDPDTHRYVFDVPRSEHMVLRFDALRLATRHLLTLSEARGHLVGALEVEHLAPPPAPPGPAAVALREAEGVPAAAWAGGGAAVLLLLGLGGFAARRRGDPIRALVKRAAAARAAIGREVLALGPAFDPVAASAERLVEVARQHAAHHGPRAAAIARARAGAPPAGGARRPAHIASLIDKAERAGRNADSARARSVDALVAELGGGLDAAVAAEEELAL